MEDFNYQMASRNEHDALEPLEFNCENNFINRSEFTSTDVERVLMEAQESILNSMEPIGNCQDTNSYLNPINDILGDICEFSKNFGVNNHMGVCPPQATQSIVAPLNSLNCNWSMTEPPSTSSYIGVPTTSTTVVPTDSVTHDSGYFNISSASEGGQLQLTSEYPTPDTSLLSCDYVSSFNQLFQNFEQQQYLMSTPLAAIAHPSTQVAHSFSDAFLSTIGSLPASTTITPITGEERQIGHRPISPIQQQEVTIEARYVSDRETKTSHQEDENFVPSCENVSTPVVPFHQFAPQQYEDGSRYQNCSLKRNSMFNVEAVAPMGQISAPQQHKVIAVLNQNQYPQVVAPMPICGTLSNQNMCLMSQKTHSPTIDGSGVVASKLSQGALHNRFNWSAVFPRKHFIHPPEMIIMHPLRTRKLMTTRRTASTGTTIDLSEYFDTSSINIPMIRERPRSETKNENRRKQKLNIIPGAENLVFEIQRNEEHESAVTLSSLITEQPTLERDPYPETELPELEEIFKRKKKTTLSTSSGKRTNIAPPIVAAPQQKKQCVINVTTNQQSSVQESSTSFDEKISLSIAIRQGRSKISIDRVDTSSESDSVESDIGLAQGAKSLKCQKCMKLFKSTRSLAIHTKRCEAVAKESFFIHEINAEMENGNLSTDEAKICFKIQNDQIGEKTFEIDLTNCEEQEDPKKFKTTISSEELKARPITRSQTRRTTGSMIRSTITTKRSK